MSLSLRPEWVFDDFTEVTAEFLASLGVTLLLTDLDFTLAPKKVAAPDETVKRWLSSLREEGIEIVILSNNRNPRRVRRFCEGLGIDYVGHAQKPYKRGYLRAMERHGRTAGQTAMLGDKLLTDCLGAHRTSLPMLMVEPKGGANGPWQKVLYVLQEPFKRSSPRDMRKKMKK